MRKLPVHKYLCPHRLTGVAQTTQQGFGVNGESALDLEYAFGLTNPQPILLLQTGDLVEGTWDRGSTRLSMSDHRGPGASFNNWLDAVDGSFCTFEGGDDPTQASTLNLVYQLGGVPILTFLRS